MLDQCAIAELVHEFEFCSRIKSAIGCIRKRRSVKKSIKKKILSGALRSLVLASFSSFPWTFLTKNHDHAGHLLFCSHFINFPHIQVFHNLKAHFSNNEKISTHATMVYQTFPFRLHHVLEEVSKDEEDASIISWTPEGATFKIHDLGGFKNAILPKYFPKQSKFKSFKRQLQYYGFDNFGDNHYGHSRFLRGHKHLICKIEHRAFKKHKNLDASSTSSSEAPSPKPGHPSGHPSGQLHKHVPRVFSLKKQSMSRYCLGTHPIAPAGDGLHAMILSQELALARIRARALRALVVQHYPFQASAAYLVQGNFSHAKETALLRQLARTQPFFSF